MLSLIFNIIALVLFAGIAFVVVSVTDNLLSDYDVEGYLETHPPISDEYFVKLCGPDTNAEVALKVRRIIAEISCVDESQIYPDARLIRDLGLD